MSRGYAIQVEYKKEYSTGMAGTQTLYVNANSHELATLLGVLDLNDKIAGITVFHTLTIPSLHKFTKLTRDDLSIGLGTLEKLK